VCEPFWRALKANEAAPIMASIMRIFIEGFGDEFLGRRICAIGLGGQEGEEILMQSSCARFALLPMQTLLTNDDEIAVNFEANPEKNLR
jgi:hypothetical protein